MTVCEQLGLKRGHSARKRTTLATSKRICQNWCEYFFFPYCFLHRWYLGRGMDPDGRVEQNVVTQLLEKHDAILQIAQVSGKGQYDVQDGPRHVHLRGLQSRKGGSSSRGWQTKERYVIKGVRVLGRRSHHCVERAHEPAVTSHLRRATKSASARLKTSRQSVNLQSLTFSRE